MNEGKIAIRYARALHSLAVEQNLQDLLRVDMEVVQSLISGVDEFKLLINNPVIKPSVKIDFLNTLFGEKFQKITLNFLDLVVRNNRLGYIGQMARVFTDLCKKNDGIESAILTTPYPIDKDTRHSMIKHIEKKLDTRIELEEKTNEELIGGFVLRIGNQQIDASVSNVLARIRTQLLYS
ncbi:MAG: ATP synthase F1 subunit delta [Bacteroidales bacterium]|nr:ATP synthase F1 subunit delta [Bacteroidales bacterium]